MAETRSESLPIDPALPVAIKVQGANLTWESPPAATTPKKIPAPTAQRSFIGRLRARFSASKVAGKPSSTPAAATEKPATNTPPVKEPFKMGNINLEIPRGQLCAIVGPVGSGKSSLLQGLIGGESTLLQRMHANDILRDA